MGKRKKASKPPPKAKRPTLEKVFDCPMCGNENCVDSKIDATEKLGTVSCRNCKEHFVKKVHKLEKGVDVYASWIDSIEDANNAGREDDERDF
ncbi:Transcription elongation factor 1-like [Porphyridium purpureum]|uniref:Transcription elongation factor 1 homolog n=1 Tax=Porphyridium purpureum TaxID=35688 RepID=A0A5J4YNT3_PORPP|nr:Transcription elongation factor 1-like [Porphyridium purpureum]|eukprot:POR1310..scf222_8